MSLRKAEQAESKSLRKELERMKPAQKMMVNMWRRNASKRKGRRFTFQEKAMCLSVLKCSPKSYRFQKNLIDLPNEITLKKMEAEIPIHTGTIIQIFII